MNFNSLVNFAKNVSWLTVAVMLIFLVIFIANSKRKSVSKTFKLREYIWAFAGQNAVLGAIYFGIGVLNSIQSQILLWLSFLVAISNLIVCYQLGWNNKEPSPAMKIVVTFGILGLISWWILFLVMLF